MKQRTQASLVSPPAVCCGFSEKQSCQFLVLALLPGAAKGYADLEGDGSTAEEICPAENLTPRLKEYVNRMLITQMLILRMALVHLAFHWDSYDIMTAMLQTCAEIITRWRGLLDSARSVVWEDQERRCGKVHSVRSPGLLDLSRKTRLLAVSCLLSWVRPLGFSVENSTKQAGCGKVPPANLHPLGHINLHRGGPWMTF